MKKSVTAKDIAKLCGVSQATVSYIINNRSDQKISSETRRKVMETIEALHYYPNASARNMRTKNCTSIGIVPRLQPPGLFGRLNRNQRLPFKAGLHHYHI